VRNAERVLELAHRLSSGAAGRSPDGRERGVPSTFIK
jgi:hypothetical protein